jgi:hypothetical protein
LCGLDSSVAQSNAEVEVAGPFMCLDRVAFPNRTTSNGAPIPSYAASQYANACASLRVAPFTGAHKLYWSSAMCAIFSAARTI